MPEAMSLQDMFVGTLAGAAIVVMGAFYALFYALAKMHGHRGAHATALASYAGLVVATYFLVDALKLYGIWMWVASVMVAGYFLMPRAIWRLCVGTHEESAT